MKKKCSRCKEWKSFDKFSKRSDTKKDGLQPVCKSCNKKWCDEWYQKNKLKKIEKSGMYDKLNALYNQYCERLTIDEDPRLHKDGVSLEVKCRYCGKYFIPTNGQVKHRIQALDKGFHCH